jgi:hypothetical protein
MGSFSERPIPLEGLSSARLWASLDAGTRALAARSLYHRDWGDGLPRREADVAIARALRFREAAVRQLPIEKRVDYLIRAVRPDDLLASSLLLGLHLEARRPMLCAFLDELGLPHHDGLIDEDHELTPLPAERLAPALASLLERFPREEVLIYASSLLAMDPETWGGLKAVPELRGAERP